jgi:hypothetical protein
MAPQCARAVAGFFVPEKQNNAKKQSSEVTPYALL